MSQIEKYAHVLPRMFYTGSTTTIGAQQTGGTKGPRFRASDDGRRTRRWWYVQYNTTSSRGGGVDGNWYGNDCVASRVGENNDVDGRRRRSGQASGAGRKTGGRETMCLGTGAEWAPCGIVQEGGCHSGDV